MKTFSGRKPSQHPFELKWFTDLLLERGVTRYLEIGARDGDTFHHVMSALPEGSFGVALDLPGAKWGRGDSHESLNRAAEDIGAQGKTAMVVLADSQQRKTADAISEAAPFDAILIDGDHTLAGATRDWTLYGEMAPLVAFHDIVGEGINDKKSRAPVQVPTLWAELKEAHEVVEFVATGSKMGIGVVCK